MADIRIKDLPTTASQTSSGDFIAIDGLSNGTRKLSANAPSFLGNITTTTTLADQGGTISAQRNGLAPRQGLVFDGTTGATVASVPAFGTGDFTVSAWVRPNSLSVGYETYIVGGATGCFALRMENTTGLLSFLKIGGGLLGTSSSGLTAGKWALVTLSRSSGSNQFYINGVAIGSAISNSADYTVATTQIGNVASNYPWVGGLSPLMHNRALSAAEVLALYQSSAPAGADYNGVLSNVNLLTAGGPWTNYSSSFNVAFASADGSTVSGTSSTGIGYVYTPITFTAGSRYRVTGTATGVTGATLYVSTTAPILSSPQQGIGTIPLGTSAIDFSWVETTGGSRSFVVNTISAIATSFALTNLRVWKDGLLLAPDSAQAGGGLTWYDTSGNAANITLPATGVSWSLPFSGNITSPVATNLTLRTGTSGAAITVLSASNHVGIGTAAPSNPLHLKAPAGSLSMRFEDGTAGLIGFIGGANGLVSSPISGTMMIRSENGLYLSGTGNSADVFIKNGGNVGIGTTTPTNGQLEIGGNSDAAGSPNRPRLALTNTAGTAVTWSIQPWSTSGDANLSIYRSGSTGNILLVPTGGNVGIGTTSPVSLLELKSAAPVVTLNGTDNTQTKGIDFATNGSVQASIRANIQSGEFKFSSGTSGYGGFMVFATDTVERMRIAVTSGNVSIASSTAGSSGAGALVVTGGLATGAASYIGGALTANSGISFAGEINKIGHASGYLVAVADGTNNGLYWDDSANTLNLFTASGAGAVSLNQSGVLSVSGAATFAGAVTVAGKLSVGSLTNATDVTSQFLSATSSATTGDDKVTGILARYGGTASGARTNTLAFQDANTGDTSTIIGAVVGTRRTAGTDYSGGLDFYVSNVAGVGNPAYSISTMTKALSLSYLGAATFAGTVIAPAATASLAPLRIPHGTAPTSPTDGDMWSTTAGLFIRINGVTKTVTLT